MSINWLATSTRCVKGVVGELEASQSAPQNPEGLRRWGWGGAKSKTVTSWESMKVTRPQDSFSHHGSAAPPSEAQRCTPGRCPTASTLQMLAHYAQPILAILYPTSTEITLIYGCFVHPYRKKLFRNTVQKKKTSMVKISVLLKLRKRSRDKDFLEIFGGHRAWRKGWGRERGKEFCLVLKDLG